MSAPSTPYWGMLPPQASVPSETPSNGHSSYIPYVVERTGRGERTYDIYSRLLEDRIIILRAITDDEVANSIVAQLLFLEKAGPNQDVKIYIQSPGGIVTSGLAIYDAMKMISCDVQTFVMGQACSMGALLLGAGAKGKRFALPNARVMIHQLRGGNQGTAQEMDVSHNETMRMHDQLRELMAADCGKTVAELDEHLLPFDKFLMPDEAKEFGLIDEVLAYPDAAKEAKG